MASSEYDDRHNPTISRFKDAGSHEFSWLWGALALSFVLFSLFLLSLPLPAPLLIYFFLLTCVFIVKSNLIIMYNREGQNNISTIRMYPNFACFLRGNFARKLAYWLPNIFLSGCVRPWLTMFPATALYTRLATSECRGSVCKTM